MAGSPLTDFALLARRPDEVLDLEDLCLAIARMGSSTLDTRHVSYELDLLAERIGDRVSPGSAPDRLASQLAAGLHGTLGFHGTAEVFATAEGSYLPSVLERRTGLPILLGAVWILIGRRLGVRVDGVGFPGRFLVSVADTHGIRVWVDPFGGGAQVPVEGLIAALPPGVSRDVLEPASPRAIGVRVLTNLKHRWLDDGEHERALAAVDRILLLGGERPAELRDRGLLAAHVNRPSEARRDLRRYLVISPNASDRASVEALLARL